jgi:hypothetical protein
LLEPLEDRRLLSVAIGTDQPDYEFGATVNISGSGYAPGETVQLQVLHALETPGSNADPQNQPWLVTAEPSGNISSVWAVTDPDAPGSTYVLTGVGLSSGETAQTVFTDGAIFTTDVNGTVNQNHYTSKQDVYLNGGGKGAKLDPDSYYVRVTDPSGHTVLGTSVGTTNETPILVDSNGKFHQNYQLWAIVHKGSDGTQGYDDTPDHDSKYKVWISSSRDFRQGCGTYSTDNFEVRRCPPPTFTISGTKYEDLTGYGFSSDDTPLSRDRQPVTIELHKKSDTTLVDTTQTDGAGNYYFTDVLAGQYYVIEQIPDGWTKTAETGRTIDTQNPYTLTGNNFDDFENIIISGRKYQDTKGDDGTAGISSDDTRLAGWQINLSGSATASTTTDLNGDYSFGPLGPGTYTVSETPNSLPGTWTQTFGSGGYAITVGGCGQQSGQNASGKDFANFKNITIGGTKYRDNKGDDGTAGISSDDTRLAGWQINLSGSATASTTTDLNGDYSFGPLGPGNYTVSETPNSLPGTWTQTFGSGGYAITVGGGGQQSGQNASGKDFANFKNIKINGQKFNDLNGNGSKDPGDQGLSGWHILLDGFDRATTAADGSYSIGNVGPGTHSVQEVLQVGWVPTRPTTVDVTPSSGCDVTVDFGNRKRQIIVIAADKSPSAPQQVKVIDKLTGNVLSQFTPYENTFLGGVRVAVGDLTGDRIDEIVTAPGRGRAPEIRVFAQDGTELQVGGVPIYRTMAYLTTYTGGVDVAVGDVNGDGRNDIVTIPSYGAAQVRVFLGQAGADPIANSPYKPFLAFPSSFIGGGVVAVADMGKMSGTSFVNTLDLVGPKAEIIVGSGAGTKATVKVFEMSGTPNAVRTFNPFSTSMPTFSGGVSLHVAPINAGDGVPDIVVGAGSGGNSQVEVWAWNSNALSKVGSFIAFGDSTSKQQAPVRVTTLENTGDGRADAIVAVQGPDGTSKQIRSFNISSPSPLSVSVSTSFSQVPPPSGYPGPYFITTIENPLPTLFPSASPLVVSGSGVGPVNSINLVTQAALQPIVEEAIRRWSAAGLDATIVNRMRQAQFVIADLPGTYLGVTDGNTIYVDRDAAGYGWFIDPTPSKDEEFVLQSVKGQMTELSRKLAAQVDLLTVVEHELGHLAGLADLNPTANLLMSGSLQPGVRRTPTGRGVDAVLAAGGSYSWALLGKILSSVNLGDRRK